MEKELSDKDMEKELSDNELDLISAGFPLALVPLAIMSLISYARERRQRQSK